MSALKRNKAVVLGFYEEVIDGKEFDLLDELLTPTSCFTPPTPGQPTVPSL